MKLKDNVSKNYVFILKISEVSRKIVNCCLKIVDVMVFYFMCDIKCRIIEFLVLIFINLNKFIVIEDKVEDLKD